MRPWRQWHGLLLTHWYDPLQPLYGTVSVTATVSVERYRTLVPLLRSATHGPLDGLGSLVEGVPTDEYQHRVGGTGNDVGQVWYT